MRILFQEELNSLHENISKMLYLTENAIDKAIEALKTQNVALAQEVIDGDDDIDKLERDIEKLCLEILIRQAPMATDFREVTATFKLITDLERIADHAEDICQIIVSIYNERYVKPLIDIPLMANTARVMVNKAITSFLNKDKALAMEVCKQDNEVDELYRKIYSELIDIMKSNPSAVEQCAALLQIAKYFERIADHATNIGEWVVFNITGKHKHI